MDCAQPKRVRDDGRYPPERRQQPHHRLEWPYDDRHDAWNDVDGRARICVLRVRTGKSACHSCSRARRAAGMVTAAVAFT